ncbi:TPA: hypothetical protein DEP58_02045 [Patescibacteria group bacterium]|nr:MAG: hypothetical protein UU98_C0015G0015 [Parcubacteria group bacterium GW2011_GWD2_42_14]HCC05066.1 hypothetical protein [Patescibacteria group bacterium]
MTNAPLQNTPSTTRGSFLLELLLAFAVISIAMTVVVDAFITSQRSYRLIAEEGALTKALTIALENITREARVSQLFRCTSTGTAPCTGTAFYMTHIEGLNNQGAGENVSYALAGGVIQKDSLDLTPPTVNVTDFDVRIIGTRPAEQIQALITLTASSVDIPNVKVQLQTSFTERLY